MAYLGSTPANRYSKVQRQNITGDGNTVYALSYPVGNENEIEVFVNNVRQEPANAYTTFGTTLTMSSAITANDSFYVVYQGKAEQSLSIIPEQDDSGHYTFDNGTLYIDSTNNRIGVNNTAPTQALTVTGNVSVSGNLSVGTGTVVISNDSITIAGSAVSPVQSFRNKIINGNFDIWQRGASGSSGYVADRWTTELTGSTAAISRQSFTLGQTDVPGEPDYYHRTVVTSSAGAGNYAITYQLIESVKTLAGQTATLSFWAKADASKNMAVEFVQNFGTGGSPSTQVNEIGVTTIALTTSWQKFTVTVDVPSISGKTLGTNNSDWLGVFFWFDAGSDLDSRTNTLGQQSGTFDIAQVQLEAGSVATPFEERPIGQELALCQRYYEIGRLYGSSYFWIVAANANDYFEATYCFKQTKRASPTIVSTNLGTGTIATQVADVDAAAFKRTGAFDSPLNISFTASAEF